MDFELTAEQVEIRNATIQFAEKALNGDITENEKNNRFPVESWKKCAEFNLMALPFPEKYGGCGEDLLTTAVCIEALASSCKDNGLIHAVLTHIICGLQIMLFSSELQKENYLPHICSGTKIAAQAITEADAGSDMSAMRTNGVKDSNGYILNGTKLFISNGSIADFAIVYAVTDAKKIPLSRISCFIVDKEREGFQRSKPIEKMGLKTLQNCELIFENCIVPDDRLLGKKGQGMIMFTEMMEIERTLLFASHVGTLQRILSSCKDYAKLRRQFGNAISRYQLISSKIVKMKVNLELGRLMLYKAAWLKSKKKRASVESSILKLFISESLKEACMDAIQIFGAYGFMNEYEIERDLRDSIASTIYSGTSEMQINIIAKLLGL